MKAWITYSYDDNLFVEIIKNGLSDESVEFIDAETEILPGDNIVETVYGNISKADVIFVVLSKNNSNREWFSTEIGILISEISQDPRKKIIPILKDKDADIPAFINQYQFVDFTSTSKYENGFKLLNSVFERSQKIKGNLKTTSSNQKFYGGGDISINVLENRKDLLKNEQEKYEKYRKEKQRIYILTLLITVFASILTLTAFILSNEKFLKVSSDSYIVIIFSLLTGLASGILMKSISDRIKGRK